MTYSSCLQKFGAGQSNAPWSISFALSEIPQSAYLTRQPSARIKAKRDRGEEIDYVDLANGEIKPRDHSTPEPRIKKSKLPADPSEIIWDGSTLRFQESSEANCFVPGRDILSPSFLLGDSKRMLVTPKTCCVSSHHFVHMHPHHFPASLSAFQGRCMGIQAEASRALHSRCPHAPPVADTAIPTPTPPSRSRRRSLRGC
jgi:hypothetical protein